MYACYNIRGQNSCFKCANLCFLVLLGFSRLVLLPHCCPKGIFIVLYIKGLIKRMENGCEHIKPYG